MLNQDEKQGLSQAKDRTCYCLALKASGSYQVLQAGDPLTAVSTRSRC